MSPPDIFLYAPAANPTDIILSDPTVARSSGGFQAFARPIATRFAAGLFAVHSVVGVAVPHRGQAIKQSAVVAQVRSPAPRIQSFVGRGDIQVAVAPHIVIARPTVASVRLPVPAVRSFVGKGLAQGNRGFGHALIAQVRTPLSITRSFIGRANPKTIAQAAAISRANPTVALTRTPPPQIDSAVGVHPHIVALVPFISRARAIVATVRSLIPIARQTIGTARAGIRAAIPLRRPRPTTALVRIPLPLPDSAVGCSIARGPAIQLTFAMATSQATVSLSPALSASDAIMAAQSLGAGSIASSNSSTVALAPSQSATLSITPSE